jgi:hypothetical protein
MLLIGVPKSASTSLMQSIAKILNIKYQNGISRKKYDKTLFCEGFEEMQEFYGTTIKRDYKFLEKWINRQDVIYKEHLLPTKEHIEYIKQINKPVVILTRDSSDCIDNHIRTIELYKNGKLSKREQKGLVINKMIKLDLNKLKIDFDNFNNGWLNANLKNALYITFNELVLHPKRTIKRVLNHYGYKTLGLKLELVKAKGNRGDYNTYTGVGLERLKNADNCTA